jgi:type I restriction enzyme M protein
MVAKIKNDAFSYTVPAGYTIDYVSEKQVKETNKELVRQRVARALIHEYGFSPDDMECVRLVDARNSILQSSIMGKSTRLRT